MDSRRGDPLPWIDAAKPTYPALIDRDHRLAELYGIVNVPQAVWIDEAGRIDDGSRLHPDSWCLWRQGAGVTEQGLAAQPDFWQRVDALGEQRYYARVDMAGMP